jgi:hypothetical protein
MHLNFRSPVTFFAVLSVSGTSRNLLLMPYEWFVAFVLFLLLAGPSVAAAAQKSQVATESYTNLQQLVREVVQNGLRLNDKDQFHWSYREVIRKEGRSETHEVCQTSAGTLDRIIAINNQPLSAEQQRREDARIQGLLANAGEMRKERQKQREDAAKQYRMFATFPVAFRYQYAGTEGSLLKLKFEPNPDFIPESRQEEVFHHLEGMMWIDTQQRQLARIDGRLTSEVRFAGGLLGHLDNGGVFSVKFKQVDSGPWLMALLEVNMTGRALFFKTISVQEEAKFDDYRRLPNSLTLRQGAELLEKMSGTLKQTAANTPGAGQ